MRYIETPNNLITLLRTAGALSKEEILRFFEDVSSRADTEYYLRVLAAERRVDYDEETQIVKWHTYPKLDDAEEKLRIRAFWVLTSFQSRMVRTLDLLPYPHQFYFIAADEESTEYDVSVCDNEHEARIIKRQREKSMLPGYKDDVCHIAVVPNKSIGEKIEPYGFDSYCVFSEEHRPNYFSYE